jgi:prephenate dehydrogenase
MDIKRLTIIGLGLMGGSMGLALRQSGMIGELIGVDRDEEAMATALQIGAVHRVTRDLAEAVSQSEVVIVATPVSQITPIFRQVAPHLSPGTLVSDVGSSKGKIVQEARELFPPEITYIGGHPMAGSERGGIRSADPYLLENALYILTPWEETTFLLEKLEGLVHAMGARSLILHPDHHDRVVAAVSHLPHLIAAVLVNTLAEAAQGDDVYLSLAAGGFRDTTRIASGDPYLWRDIFFSNKEPLLQMIEIFQQQIDLFKELLMGDGDEALVDFLVQARRIRQTIPEKTKGLLAPLFQIVVKLVDQPGAISQVAFLLAEEGINIIDIEILRIREGEGGTLCLGLDNSLDVEKAIDVLQQAGFSVGER